MVATPLIPIECHPRLVDHSFVDDFSSEGGAGYVLVLPAYSIEESDEVMQSRYASSVHNNQNGKMLPFSDFYAADEALKRALKGIPQV